MVPNIAVILTNAEKRIMWVNDDFTQITGYSLEEALGQSPGQLLQGPATEPDAIENIRKGLQQKVPFRSELTNYRKNGEPYLCRLVIHPVFDHQQQLTNYIAFEVDGNFVTEEVPLPLLDLREKYSSSSLKGIEELRLYVKMRQLVEQEKLYLSPSLSLREVASQLDTNTKYLSQVVNHHAGCNFQHFINRYRIEEVKEKIKDGQFANLTLFGIARQCGFQNKSTFYKVFKEITDQTPKEYLKG